MTSIALPRTGLRSLVDALIESPLPANDKEIFSTFTPTTTNSYNSGCWAAAYDFSGVCWHWGSGSNVYGGALVTDRHVICASHYASADDNAIGETLYFNDGVDSFSGHVVEAQTDLAGTDICVLQLADAVPGTCKTYSVLPADWQSRFNVPETGVDIDPYAIITTDQEQKALIHDLAHSHPAGEGSFTLGIPGDATRLLYYELIGQGDSGNPWFWPLTSSEMALVGTAWQPTTCVSLSNYIDEINTAIDDFAGTSGYELDVLDLSWIAEDPSPKRSVPPRRNNRHYIM